MNSNFKVKTWTKKNLRKAIVCALLFVLILFLTNPALIPFTSKEFKENATNTWESLFGDVNSVTETFTLNWTAVFKLIAMVLLMVALSNLAGLILTKITPKTGTGKSVKSLLSNGISYLFVIVGIIWGLSILGVSVTAIFAGVGILALIVSFSAESLIEDIITGIFLVFDKQFNVGDIIEIDGFRGTVIQIGVRATYIKGPGGNVQILNNASIKKVLNRSLAESIASCEVSVSYSADLRYVEQVLAETLPKIKDTYPDIFPEAPTYLGVQSLADSAVVLKIIAKVDEANIYSAPRCMLREIKLAFDEKGVEIPFPQVVVHEAGK